MQRKLSSSSSSHHQQKVQSTPAHLIKFNFGGTTSGNNNNNPRNRTTSTSTITPLKRLRLLVARAFTLSSNNNRNNNSQNSNNPHRYYISHGDIPLILGACRTLHNSSFFETQESQKMVKNAVDAALSENLNRRSKINSYVRLLWFVAAPTQGRTGRLVPSAAARSSALVNSAMPSNRNSKNNDFIHNPFEHEFARMLQHSQGLIETIQSSIHERFAQVAERNPSLKKRTQKRHHKKKKIVSIIAEKTKSSSTSSRSFSTEEDIDHQETTMKFNNMRRKIQQQDDRNLSGVRSTDIAQISAAIVRGLSASSDTRNKTMKLGETLLARHFSFETVLNVMDCWALLSLREKRTTPKAIHLTLLSAARLLRLFNSELMQENATNLHFKPPSEALSGIKQPLDDIDAELMRQRRLVYRRALINFTEAFAQRIRGSGVIAFTTGYKANSLFEHELKEICQAILDTFIWNERKSTIDRNTVTTVKNMYKMLYRRARTVSKFTQGEIGPSMKMLHYICNNFDEIRNMKSPKMRKEFLIKNCAEGTVVKVSYNSALSNTNSSITNNGIARIPINGLNLVLALMKARELKRIRDLIEKERRDIQREHDRVVARFGEDDSGLVSKDNKNNNHQTDEEDRRMSMFQQQQEPTTTTSSSSSRHELAYLEEDGLLATATEAIAADEPHTLSTHHKSTPSKTFTNVKVASSSTSSSGDDPWLSADSNSTTERDAELTANAIDRILSSPSTTSSSFSPRRTSNEIRKEATLISKRKSVSELTETEIASFLLLSSNNSNKLEPNHGWVKMLPTQALDQNTAVTIFLRQLSQKIESDENLRFLLTHDDCYILKLLVTKTSDWVRHFCDQRSLFQQPVAARWALGSPLRLTVQSLALLPSRLGNSLKLASTSPGTLKFVSLVVQKLIQDVFLPLPAASVRPLRSSHEDKMRTHVGLRDGTSISDRKFRRSNNINEHNNDNNNSNMMNNNNNNNYLDNNDKFSIQKTILSAQTFSPLEGYHSQNQQERLREELEDKIVVAEFAADASAHFKSNPVHQSFSRHSFSNTTRDSSGFYSLAFVADMLRMIRWCSWKTTWCDQGVLSTLTEAGNSCAARLLAKVKSELSSSNSISNKNHHHHRQQSSSSSSSLISHPDIRSLIEIVYSLQRLNIDVFVETRAVIDVLSKADFDDFVRHGDYDNSSSCSELRTLRQTLNKYIEGIQKEKEQEDKERVTSAPVASLLELAQQRAKERELERARNNNNASDIKNNRTNKGPSSLASKQHQVTKLTKEQEEARKLNEQDLRHEDDDAFVDYSMKTRKSPGTTNIVVSAKEKVITELTRKVSSAITRKKYEQKNAI